MLALFGDGRWLGGELLAWLCVAGVAVLLLWLAWFLGGLVSRGLRGLFRRR